MSPRLFRRWMALLLPLACGLILATASPAASVRTADPNASEGAKRLLAYLASLPSHADHRIVSGQAIGRAGGYGPNDMVNGYAHLVEQLHNQTGQWVGLIGASYGQKQARGRPPFTDADQVLARYWNAGGLVTVAWFAPNPWNGGKSDTQAEGDFNELFKPGTAVYSAYHAELDELALDLDELQRAGVVVLFRPFHEQNGSWFWWGAQHGRLTKEQFASLWRSALDYLTRTKSLHNLLWVFAPSGRAPVDPLAFYPGSDAVDVVGIDDYEAGEPNIPSYKELQGLGKPIALTEFGPNKEFAERSPHTYDFAALQNALRHRYDKFTYFMIWNGTDGRPQALVENRNAAALLNDPWVANRADIARRQQ
jgi:mannan endo-1,4-beta-mannosidase